MRCCEELSATAPMNPDGYMTNLVDGSPANGVDDSVVGIKIAHENDNLRSKKLTRAGAMPFLGGAALSPRQTNISTQNYKTKWKFLKKSPSIWHLGPLLCFLAQNIPKGGNGSVKRGGNYWSPTKIICVLDAEFNLHYDCAKYQTWPNYTI